MLRSFRHVRLRHAWTPNFIAAIHRTYLQSCCLEDLWSDPHRTLAAIRNRGETFPVGPSEIALPPYATWTSALGVEACHVKGCKSLRIPRLRRIRSGRHSPVLPISSTRVALRPSGRYSQRSQGAAATGIYRSSTVACRGQQSDKSEDCVAQPPAASQQQHTRQRPN